jgi:glycosyltransferase involved in cell wall biosynthesis
MYKKGELKVDEIRVALVHDELTRRGGAEIVLEELIRIFPQAHVYALYAGKPVMTVDGKRYDIRTSFLQKFPLWFRRHPSRLLPLLPQAAEQFDFSSYDLVISSASSFAKGIITRVNVPSVCYCHTTTRYLWDCTHEVLKNKAAVWRSLGKILFHHLRLADYAAAQRVDSYIANSKFTKDRINSYYLQPSSVVYPPIDTVFYTPGSDTFYGPRPSFLAVGRLSRMKYFDQAIGVCEKLRFPLTIVGVGPDLNRLKRMSGKYITFAGRVSNEELRELYRQSSALIQPGTEDFGMATAEALSSGTPVIAYGGGGVKEIVDHKITGLLYNEQKEEMLAETIRQFIKQRGMFLREEMQKSVLRFSRERFKQDILKTIKNVLEPK